MSNSDGTFRLAEIYSSVGGTAWVAADLNGDGKLDSAVACGQGAAILLGNGDGTFQPAIIVQ